jgi:GNAT superfamily N-acetyltransferase
MSKKVLRRAQENEGPILHEIRWQAWKIAYKNIYNEATIQDFFHGETCEKRTWQTKQFTHEENLVCQVGDEIVGFATFGWTPMSSGELKSFYVLPQYWNKGIGSMMWKEIMEICSKNFLVSFDIWVLNRARSRDFYVVRGCTYVTNGDYIIGNQTEVAACYRWVSTREM